MARMNTTYNKKPRIQHPESSLPDHITGTLSILFVGINPGLRSAALGHHYAGPSNRFWKLLYDANLVPERLTYRDDWRLPEWGLGLTNLAPRATAGINGLTSRDYAVGRLTLGEKIHRYRPRTVALLGITLYPILFPSESKKTGRRPGLQPVTLHGSDIVLLPNPSGRNASYSYHAMLKAFRTLAPYLAQQRRQKPIQPASECADTLI
jgi:TDG/mug DNA glycosylase family protein